jgi:hypothetical protein
LGYLRELLGDEVEFEARYPAAYELLFGGSRALSGLPLPSFGARVLRNDPQWHALSAGRRLSRRHVTTQAHSPTITSVMPPIDSGRSRFSSTEVKSSPTA